MSGIKTRAISAILTVATFATAAVATTVSAFAVGTAATPAPVTAPATIASNTVPFVQGVSASNFTAKLNEGKGRVYVNWNNNITGAKYVVYSIVYNRSTGKFGDWEIIPADGDGSSFGEGWDYKASVNSEGHGITHYITVLPYTDTPTRQYGSFSPYVVINKP
ncbi:hypothetical protein FACS1894133_2180 [Clostridia bacterium]|nr:hypothetical protein FACS1894133_2180 [Clostridia bacterium]